MSTFHVIDGSNSINDTANGDIGVNLNGGDSVLVQSTGSVLATGLNATGINANNNDSTIRIDGLVYGDNEAVSSFADNIKVIVNGQASGGQYAMYLNGDNDNVTIGAAGQADGAIVLTGDGSKLINNGTISVDASGPAVYLGSSSLYNNGLIASGGAAIHFQGDSTGIIVNTGTIVGELNEQVPLTSVGGLNITNSGLWTGGDLDLTDGQDTLVNTGTITGDVSLENGNDTLDSSNGHVFGRIDGGGGNDTLKGGSEDNYFVGGTGADLINGGGGENTVDYSASSVAVAIDLTRHTAQHGDASGDTLSHIQDVLGTLYNDTLNGNGSDNLLNGVIGKDTINGYDGDDTMVELGAGSATLNGGDGDDLVQLSNFDQNMYGKSFSAQVKIDGGNGFDTVELSGDYAAGVTFNTKTMLNVEMLKLDAGFNYKLTTNNATVAAGETLTVDATLLDAHHRVSFHGNAESDGSFVLEGGDGKDTLIGGKGDDTFNGGISQDKITGGLGHDVFVYTATAESNGLDHDIITDFDAVNDTFLLPTAVAHIDAAVTSGSVATGSINADIASAVSGHLLAHDAILVTADAGGLSGHTFLVVDGNGVAGYNGGDYLFDVTGMTGTLTTSDFTV